MGVKERIQGWASSDNISAAKGKSKKEILKIFGNKLEPVGNISLEYAKHLSRDIEDNTVYSGKGYFIDHVVNHHPEVDLSEYERIQDVLSNPDDVKLDDTRNKQKNSIIFIKKYDNFLTTV